MFGAERRRKAHKENFLWIDEMVAKTYLTNKVLLYINQRAKPAVIYYDRMGKWYRNQHKGTRILGIILAAAIPLINVFPDVKLDQEHSLQLVIASILGAIISILGSINTFSRYHDKWLSYRSTCEQLRQELIRFLFTGYDSGLPEVRDREFILRFESIIAQEYDRWFDLTQDSKNDGNQKPK